VWMPGIWRHFAWTFTLGAKTAAGLQLAKWRIYIDGDLQKVYDGIFPIDGFLTTNYLGNSDATSTATFTGHMDSFAIYPVALSLIEVRFLMAVCMHACMYVCIYLYVYVYIYSFSLIEVRFLMAVCMYVCMYVPLCMY
jgi:hypothetical protein